VARFGLMQYSTDIASHWRQGRRGSPRRRAPTLDRLRHGAHKVVLDRESYRGLKPDAETLRTQLAKGGKIKQP
jgi:hypothetical protein